MPSRASCGGLCPIELLLGPGTNFVKFCVQPSDLCIQLYKTQAGRSEQPVSLHTLVILADTSFDTDADGRLG